MAGRLLTFHQQDRQTAAACRQPCFAVLHETMLQQKGGACSALGWACSRQHAVQHQHKAIVCRDQVLLALQAQVPHEGWGVHRVHGGTTLLVHTQMQGEVLPDLLHSHEGPI